MSRHTEKFVRVLTIAGPETWKASRLAAVRHALREETPLRYAFVLDIGRRSGRRRAWGPSSVAKPGDRTFVLSKRRPLRPAEADVYLGCIEQGRDGLNPEAYRASKNMQSASTVKHQLQRALNTVFGKKAERHFEMFVPVDGVYRFDPQRDDFLVIVDEDVQPANEDQSRPTPELVAQPDVPTFGAPRSKASRARGRSSVSVSLESAWDLREGEIKVESSARNPTGTDNELRDYRLTIGGRRLASVGEILPRSGSWEKFLCPPTELRIKACRTVRRTCRFAVPSGMTFEKDAEVVLSAVDIGGAPVRAKTRLSIAR